MANYSGFNEKTAERLILDAGAFYKNYNVEIDTPETASAKLLGATRGGGEFVATPEVRSLEIDGVKGRAKGLTVIDSWDVSILANMLEMSADLMKIALTGGEVDTIKDTDYDIIKGKNTIAISDYIDNITWIGRLSGNNKPVIIQVLNALSTDGFTLTTEDKNESVIPIRFSGHYDTENLDNPPFVIYYPKTVVAPIV
ncbi:hypothetical protein [Paenibacillus sp. sgz302251]|uniref:hypothetical protein n=1 Tax=Paenibacillus sp. sgz302251 TaxID=3414493 RepID=UPI003C7D61C5